MMVLNRPKLCDDDTRRHFAPASFYFHTNHSFLFVTRTHTDTPNLTNKRGYEFQANIHIVHFFIPQFIFLSPSSSWANITIHQVKMENARFECCIVFFFHIWWVSSNLLLWNLWYELLWALMRAYNNLILTSNINPANSKFVKIFSKCWNKNKFLQIYTTKINRTENYYFSLIDLNYSHTFSQYKHSSCMEK